MRAEIVLMVRFQKSKSSKKLGRGRRVTTSYRRSSYTAEKTTVRLMAKPALRKAGI